ncbi:hypothetical protein KIPB_001834 [Kipferlia bialata]|uniref:Lipid-binding serum glycoprotein N-terminal domain-containing protein n=1 Tax=Kipferlia bialata TaxID=797122 RepID=A0A9K3GG85_9EUKA|nr:hypothetical protein KIPB_001834 [Kipferlia bialata]|eukprot:g1834.t1
MHPLHILCGCVVLCCVGVVLGLGCPQGGEPDPSDIGAVMIMSTKGFNKAMDGEIPNLEEQATYLVLDDIDTELDLGVAVVDLSISDMHITNFHIESIEAITIPESQELELDLGDTDVNMTFDWSYTDTSWPFPSDSGTGTASCAGINGGFTYHPIYDHTCGIPQVVNDEFNLDFGNIKITLDGGASAFFQTILNVFIGLVEDLFTDQLNQVIEESMTEAMNRNLVGSLFNTDLTDGMMEDMRYPDPALVVEDSYIAAHFTGYVYPIDEGVLYPAREAIMPSPLPNLVTSEDLQFVFSNTVFESLYLSGLHLDLLHGEVDPKEVQNPQLASLLNTSTLGSICPGLFEAYPNAPISLSLETSIVPTVTVMPSAVFTNVTGTVHVSVHDDASDAYLDAFTVGYSAGMAGVPQTETVYSPAHGSNYTSLWLSYTPFNVTGWSIDSEYGPVDMEGPAAMQLEMYLSVFAVCPWLTEWTYDHAPYFGLAGDYYDWGSMYPLLEAPGTIVYNVPMFDDVVTR